MNLPFEFRADELSEYMIETEKHSAILIKNLIEKYSPIQVGDHILGIDNRKEMPLQVNKVELFAINDSWNFRCPGQKLSFSYLGIPLTKKGTPMKGRKCVWFSSFIKDGKKIRMPSYDRIQIKSARMFFY